MSAYVSISASQIRSDELKVTIPGISFKQSKILFDSGVSLCFANALSGITDTGTKNYSNFYLTQRDQLDNVLVNTAANIKPTKITTVLRKGSVASVTINPDQSFQYVDSLIDLVVVDQPEFLNIFTIEFVDNKYCTVSYDDGISKSYIVIVNGQCKLKRSPLITSTEHYLRYILNGDKLVLIADIGGAQSIITNNGGILSAVNFTNHIFNNIKENYFNIDTKINITLPESIDTQYINYLSAGVGISSDNKVSNISNNYLLTRNHTPDNLYDIIILKNQTNEIGEVGLYNTLGLSGSDTSANYRTYTSINKGVDQTEDLTLSLNYAGYNQSYNILPGINRFTTSDTLFPFSVLNINDTTFVTNGAFGSVSPLYSDKVYKETINNIGEREAYLCTWLSYDAVTDRGVWLDRYYYPNLTTKEQTLTAAIYNNTFESFVEQLINSNLGLSTSVAETQYFDKLSDFTFEPNTAYVYDRIDIDNVAFIRDKNSVNAVPGYYRQINNNNGFTLGFNVNQYAGTDFIDIASKFNSVDGGVTISYNNESIQVAVLLKNGTSSSAEFVTGFLDLPARAKNSVVCHINNNTGVVRVYLNKDLIIDEVFPPLTYNTIIYGDFVVSNEALSTSNNYISNVFLSLSPITDEELGILVAKYNTIYNSYSISLPCGMRNRTDIIKHINTLESATSKSNAIDIFLNGLDVSTEEKEELLRTIKAELVDVLPANSVINNIELL